MFQSVGRQFASQGFVVAAANYDDPDPWMDKVLLGDQRALALLYARPADVLRVIGFADELKAPGGKLAGVIDTSRIGVWGLSTGGTTVIQAAGAQIDLKAMDDWCAANGKDTYAYETCQFVGHEQAIAARFGSTDPFAEPLPSVWDRRVAALVATSPGGELHAFGDKGIAAVKVPALIMFAADDKIVSPKFNALWAYDGIGSAEKALGSYDHGGHTLFMSPWSPHFYEATALATEFFVAILKADPSARAALMPQAVSLPGVIYKTTLH
jgi:predicted dienelactone hydrolase